MPATRILVDTGALVALFDSHDRHHRAVAGVWRRIRQPVDTIWPVLTEAFHLLAFSQPSCGAMLDLVLTGAMVIAPLGREDVPRVRELMATYADLPIDFTDACLVRVAERERIRTVFTVDRRGFAVFAPRHVRRFSLWPS